MSRRPVVAIDGPAGAGKTTVTCRVAAALGYLVVSTGAIYRAVALAALEAGRSPADEDAVSSLARALAEASAIQLLDAAEDGQRVLLHGVDVTDALRREDVGQAASAVARHPGVRGALLAMQRKFGAAGGVVLEGRDIGTVVFPDAEAKFFLTASAEVRAQRRFAELEARGEAPTLSDVLAGVLRRDAADAGRDAAPLQVAPDAEVLDSSTLTVDEVVARIVARVREVTRAAAPSGG